MSFKYKSTIRTTLCTSGICYMCFITYILNYFGKVKSTTQLKLNEKTLYISMKGGCIDFKLCVVSIFLIDNLSIPNSLFLSFALLQVTSIYRWMERRRWNSKTAWAKHKSPNKSKNAVKEDRWKSMCEKSVRNFARETFITYWKIVNFIKLSNGLKKTLQIHFHGCS